MSDVLDESLSLSKMNEDPASMSHSQRHRIELKRPLLEDAESDTRADLHGISPTLSWLEEDYPKFALLLKLLGLAVNPRKVMCAKNFYALTLALISLGSVLTQVVTFHHSPTAILLTYLIMSTSFLVTRILFTYVLSKASLSRVKRIWYNRGGIRKSASMSRSSPEQNTLRRAIEAVSTNGDIAWFNRLNSAARDQLPPSRMDVGRNAFIAVTETSNKLVSIIYVVLCIYVAEMGLWPSKSQIDVDAYKSLFGYYGFWWVYLSGFITNSVGISTTFSLILMVKIVVEAHLWDMKLFVEDLTHFPWDSDSKGALLEYEGLLSRVRDTSKALSTLLAVHVLLSAADIVVIAFNLIICASDRSRVGCEAVKTDWFDWLWELTQLFVAVFAFAMPVYQLARVHSFGCVMFANALRKAVGSSVIRRALAGVVGENYTGAIDDFLHGDALLKSEPAMLTFLQHYFSDDHPACFRVGGIRMSRDVSIATVAVSLLTGVVKFYQH